MAMPTSRTGPMRYAPILIAKAKSTPTAIHLRTEALSPPRDIDGKKRYLIRLTEATSVALKLPAVLTRDQLATRARKEEEPAQTHMAKLASLSAPDDAERNRTKRKRREQWGYPSRG